MKKFERIAHTFVFTALKVVVWIGLALFFVVVLPKLAVAADQNTPVQIGGIIEAANGAMDKDMSGIGMLKGVFGELISNPLSPATTGSDGGVLGKIFMVLNMSLLAVGSVWMTYHVATGIAQTAHDGEFLGKRFSTIWVPIRFVTGVVALVPVFKGWSLAQLVIAWCALIGVGIGNMATTAVVDFVGKNGTLVSVPATTVNANFVEELYKINLCVSTHRASAFSDSRSIGVVEVGNDWLKTDGIEWHYGFDGGSECGSVTMDGKSASTSAAIAVYKRLDDTIKIKTDALAYQITPDPETGEYPAENSNARVRPNEIDVLASYYQTALQKALQAALPKDNSVAADIKNIGFTGLGIYYSKIAREVSDNNARMQIQASIQKAAPGLDSSMSNGATGDAYRRSLLLLSGTHQKEAHQAAGDSSQMADESSLVKAFTDKAASILPRSDCNGHAPADSGVGIRILESILVATGCDDSVMLRIKNVGDYLSAIGLLGVTVAATAKGLGGMLPGGDAIKVFADAFVMLMETLTFFSLMLSVYLPLVPLAAWIGGLLSWLTLVLEGVVAAPLWAFLHLDTEGEGMGQRASKGYEFAVAIMLRPILMVVGFVASLLVMNVVGKFFFMAFIQAVAAAQAGSFNGVAALVVEVGAFLSIALLIVNTSMNLIHVIPDAVISWLTHNSLSAGVGSEAGKHLAAQSGMVTAYAGSVLGNVRAKRDQRIANREMLNNRQPVGVETAKKTRRNT